MAMLRITALEGQRKGDVLQAEFNPEEVVLEYGTLWQQQSHKGPAELEFERAEPTRMSVELVFDGAKSSTSVQPQIDKLHHFNTVDTILHRPPKISVSWGSRADAIPRFDAVIESISVRYALFSENGLPLRATADVKLRQAAHVGVHAP